MESVSSNMLQELDSQLKGKNEVESLAFLAEKFKGKIVFSTSFGLEDQVITHLICSNKLPIRIFSLETGRLFEETLQTWRKTEAFYGQTIEAFYPPKELVEELVAKKGLYSFYESVENRKECCHIRKVIPLKQALAGNHLWITGIRAEQSDNRQGMSHLEWDNSNQLIKFHPLFTWSWEKVREFARTHQIPYNPLHDKGFPSIGCQPCTRAIRPGEDFRAGRWWWEQKNTKECGLHEKK